MTQCIWLEITRPRKSPHYGLWVNFFFLTICMRKFCPLPLILVVVMKWYVTNCIALCFMTIIAVRFLHLCACFICPSVHASAIHPLLAHHHLCYVDEYCVCTTIKQLFYILSYNCIILRSSYNVFVNVFLMPCLSCILYSDSVVFLFSFSVVSIVYFGWCCFFVLLEKKFISIEQICHPHCLMECTRSIEWWKIGCSFTFCKA